MSSAHQSAFLAPNITSYDHVLKFNSAVLPGEGAIISRRPCHNSYNAIGSHCSDMTLLITEILLNFVVVFLTLKTAKIFRIELHILQWATINFTWSLYYHFEIGNSPNC